jgi:hypothetical protein
MPDVDQLPLIDIVPSAALSQWFTPEPFARVLWDWAMRFVHADSFTVLEPSAGVGTLCKPALDSARVTSVLAVERDERWRGYLEQLTRRACRCHHPLEPGHAAPGCECVRCACDEFSSKLVFRIGDFLSIGEMPRFDLAFMNPPYEDGQDIAHLSRAATLCRVVVSLVHARVFWSNFRAPFWREHELLAAAVVQRGDCYPKAESEFVAIALRRARERVEGPRSISFEWL